MGIVYRARQRGLNRQVALKMIRGDGASPTTSPASGSRPRRSPGSATPISSISTRSVRWRVPLLSLELLEGGTLEDRLAGNPQPGRASAELLATLARASSGHDAGIIHRDLKPSNVLFTEDGIPKITDFGLAKRLESDSRQTETGQIMGTPSYMAPEQAKGHARDVGPAADVYALGAILYEMLRASSIQGETPSRRSARSWRTRSCRPRGWCPRSPETWKRSACTV